MVESSPTQSDLNYMISKQRENTLGPKNYMSNVYCGQCHYEFLPHYSFSIYSDIVVLKSRYVVLDCIQCLFYPPVPPSIQFLLYLPAPPSNHVARAVPRRCHLPDIDNHERPEAQ